MNAYDDRGMPDPSSHPVCEDPESCIQCNWRQLVDNGVLLCEPHHTTVHYGEWAIVMRDGVPWFIPPPHLDPGRTPIRNTVHDAITTARRAGQQMHLDLAIEPGRPPDTS